MNLSNQERALKKFESSAVLKLNRDIAKRECEKLEIQKEILLENTKYQALLNEKHKHKIRLEELENQFIKLKNQNLENEIRKIQVEKDVLQLKKQEDQLINDSQELFIQEYDLRLKEQYINNLDKNIQFQNTLLELSKKDIKETSNNMELYKSLQDGRYMGLLSYLKKNREHKDNGDFKEIADNDDKYVYYERLKIYKSLEILNIDNSKKLDILFYEKGYKTIVNCYQLQYEDNKFPTGLGDFLRGCFFLLNLCDLYEFRPIVDIYHPIAFFLHKYNEDKYEDFESFCSEKQKEQKPIRQFDKNNWLIHNKNEFNLLNNTVTKIDTMNHFCEYLYNQPVFEKKIYIYNILYPYHNIQEEHKLYMKAIMNPSVKMRMLLYERLLQLELKQKEYLCIHLRCGDDYLKNNKNEKFNKSYVESIKKELNVICNMNPDKDKLLICDNVNIKYLLLKNNEFKLKSLFYPVSHIGEGVQIEYEKIKNNMLDFYLLSESNHIYCFSQYDHGSGFSQWCATIYGIPYVCKIIKE